MAGKIYGIGVGPGDPELLTLKAVRIIKACDLLLVPGNDYRNSVAYQIAVQAVPEIAQKKVLAVTMPMTREQQVLEQSHREAVQRILGWLNEGRQIGFLNLGDITLYSTYLYLHHRILAAGFGSELINGIPSFCAAAARLEIGLANGSEQLHIIPVPEQVKDGIEQSGTKIIMKMGSHLGAVKERLRTNGKKACMVENCGMPGEQVYKTIDAVPENAGYYSLMIVKE